MKDLDELHLIYTIDGEELIPTVGNMKLKKLCISGDLLSSSENKSYINNLKKQGVKIEIVGPII